MKKNIIFWKKLWVCLYLLLGVTPLVNAQVAMPSLNITSPVVSAAAAAWNKISYGTASYYESSGDRILDDKEIYKYDSNGISSTVLLSEESFHIGGSYQSRNSTVKLDRYYDGEIPLEESTTKAYLALLLDGFAAIGVGGYNFEEKRYFDQTHKSVKTKQSAISGSTSILFLENFYVGLQADRVKQKRDNVVDNSWMDLTYGLAALFGEKEGTQIRVEYSITNSPRSEESSWKDEESNIHHKTTISRGALELKFKGLLFSGRTKQTVVKRDFTCSDTQESADKLKRVETEGSVMWVPQKGLMLGFSFIKDTTDYVYKDDHNAFKLNVGYLF